MNKHLLNERRRYKRHPYSAKFRGTRLSTSGVADPSGEILDGSVQNFSDGGLSLVVNHDLRDLEVIRGHVKFPGTAMGVPSLLQVRWVQRTPKTYRSLVGLQFMV